jgi:uncharacterized protein with gpF-like domain
VPTKVKRQKRPVDFEPFIKRYYRALRKNVRTAQDHYLGALLDDNMRLLEEVKADQVRRQGEKSAIGRTSIVQVRRGIKAARAEESFIRNLVLDDFRDTTDDLSAELRATIEKHDIEGFNLGGTASQLKIGYRGVFDLKNMAVLDEIHIRAAELGDLFADDIVDGIIDEMTVGFYDRGQNPLEVARAINSRFAEFGISRSENIARTEANVMNGAANVKQYSKIQVKLKQWLAFVDRKTRPDHRDISEQDPIPMQEPFIMPHTGDAVMYPGDSRAPARQLCRCRCDLLPVVEDVEVAQDMIWTGE